MQHFGDITKISGYTAPIVDCVVGGSPCQDLSVAGKRAGLDGERSGLFMDQIRIVKEMRERDVRDNGRSGVDIRPRYMVWENVPGAFSSNKGEDFRIVLEEIAKIKDENAVVPMPDKCKWQTSGSIVGDGYSIAWRVLDAQFWGVPQRRRRIALVADFGSQSAPEILFVRQSVSGDLDPCEPKRKATAEDAERSIGTHDSIGADQYNAVILGDTVSTLGVNCGMSHGRQCVLEPEREGVAYTMKVRTGCEVDSSGKSAGKGALYQPEKAYTLSTVQDQHLFQPVVENPAVFSKSKRAQTPTDFETWQESDTANTLNTFDQGDVRANEVVVIAFDRASFNQGKNAQFDIGISESGTAQSLVAKGPGAVCYSVDKGGGKSACNVTEGQAPTLTCTHGGEPAVCYGIDQQGGKGGANYTENVMPTILSDSHGTPHAVCYPDRSGHIRYIVRRLTPLECERLQGYPDGWTDIGEWTDGKGKTRQTSDAARYKALGNSIAIPPWKWVMKRLCACYERDATLASLFDGIGGFPYIWEQLNGKGSCLWASEIEEFPIAVTKARIGGG